MTGVQTCALPISKHCGRYNACARPVYFVRSSEYAPVYVDRGGYREVVREDRHDDRDDDHGKGRGKGHGKGKGHKD